MKPEIASVRSVSLRSALIRRLTIALALIGALGTVVAYLLGSSYTSIAYDRALADDVLTLAEQTTSTAAGVQVSLPDPALKWLLANEGESTFYRVTDLRNGAVVTSNGNLGLMPELPTVANQPLFRDIRVGGQALRLAYFRKTIEPDDVPILIEIAETLGKRNRMKDTIMGGTILFMVIIIAVSVGLVWQGVHRELLPLQALEAEAAQRSATNLLPLDTLHAPIEVHGLINAINRMMDRVSAVMESQSQFIANAAHQLRTPLAGVKLQAELALSSGTEEVMHENLREIMVSATTATHLVDQLLILAKAESAESLHDAKAIELNQLVNQVVSQYLPFADAREIDLGCEGLAQPLHIRGNSLLLSELIGNLVDNAIRYGAFGGRVTVAIACQGDEASISVIDDGEGFTEEDIGLAFTRFHRGDAVPNEGSGLGLAIVHEIAQRFGGMVTIKSSSSGGCRVDARFPVFR